MSSFFLPSKAKGKFDRKRKKLKGFKKSKESGRTKNKRPDVSAEDEEIASDSDNEEKSADHLQSVIVDEDLSEGEETAPEKRLRLAKEYLTQLKAEEKQSDEEEEDIDNDAIAHRLREEALEISGKLHKRIADQYLAPSVESLQFYRGHKLSVTSLALTPDGQYVFTGGKDCCIIKWKVSTGTKEIIISGQRKTNSSDCGYGHGGHVLALAVSSDGMYLASGGTDKVIHVWDPVTCVHLHTFRGHKDSVSGLVFQQGSHQLFSSSFDRSVKIWNVDEMIYVETLFGHQDAVVSIDCLSHELPVTAGSDKTVRVWKVIEESQLVFHGHKGSIDTVKLINEKSFISGSQDGVALWSVTKKKPLTTKRHSSTAAGAAAEQWVTAVTALPHTDLVASGSRDGYIHFWKVGDACRSLELLFSVPVPGFVNCLSFTKQGQYIVAGIGQEHKLGRWWKDTNCKNGIAVIPLVMRQS